MLDQLTTFLGRLAVLAGADTDDDAERIDRIVLLDKIAAATAAATNAEIVAFADSQLALQRDAGVSARRLGSGIAEQVALARKVSPATASRHVTAARALVNELPHTHRLLRAGEISSWVASIVVRESSELNTEDRSTLDAELEAKLPRLAPRQAEAAVRRVGYRLDPQSALRRSRTARSDRRVSMRPAPDTMALLTGFLPVEQGVAAWASLDRAARSARATGDHRSLSQLRADLLVQRLTGQAEADAVPVEVGVIINAETLTDGVNNFPARLEGYGPIPADLARRLAANPRAKVSLRSILADRTSGTVVHVGSRRRLFTGALKRLIITRDQTCRIPYCSAPIRHIDHIQPCREGGLTTASNGEGLCERHNQVKEQWGWRVHVRSSTPHCATVTTPTGHTYDSQAPPALGP